MTASLRRQLEEAQEQVELWRNFSRSKTAANKHQVTHAIVMTACWRHKVRKLERQIRSRSASRGVRLAA